MSAFNLNSLPGLHDISEKLSTTVPEVGIPNVVGHDSATSQKSTGLRSVFGQVASKGSSVILDKLLKLVFRILSFLFSKLQNFIPSSIQNFLVFIIPPLLMFYEGALRVYFPKLPSLIKIAFKLYQRGLLTMETVVWLASSLPGNFLGGLGAIGGAAMQTTAALAGGAATVGNAFVGTATGIVGGATKTVTTDIAHVLSGVPNVAGHATSLATAGLNEATALTAGSTQIAAGGLSIVKDGSTAVAENIAHLVSGEHVIAPGNLIPNITKDAVGVTQAAAGSVAKVANALEGINPLHLNIGPKESQAAQPNPLGNLLHPKLPGF